MDAKQPEILPDPGVPKGSDGTKIGGIYMLTKRENLLETIRGGHPDRFVNQYEAFDFVLNDAFALNFPGPKPGEMEVKVGWGVTKQWPE